MRGGPVAYHTGCWPVSSPTTDSPYWRRRGRVLYVGCAQADGDDRADAAELIRRHAEPLRAAGTSTTVAVQTCALLWRRPGRSGRRADGRGAG
ncbi:hypothetical protein GCM10020358_60740 [Amorphoplanes nipponensis]